MDTNDEKLDHLSQSDPDCFYYGVYMNWIRHRLICVERVTKQGAVDGHGFCDIDFLYLQFRHIFESIALSSICSHHEEYSDIYKSYKKDWKPNSIIKRVKEINRCYFPRPHSETVFDSPRDGTGGELTAVDSGFLTEDELKSYIGLCGDRLHAPNIYKLLAKGEPDNSQRLVTLADWFDRTLLLLKSHSVIIPPSPSKFGKNCRKRMSNDEFIKNSTVLLVDMNWGKDVGPTINRGSFIAPATS